MKFRNLNKIGVSQILAFLIIAVFTFLPFLSFAQVYECAGSTSRFPSTTQEECEINGGQWVLGEPPPPTSGTSTSGTTSNTSGSNSGVTSTGSTSSRTSGSTSGTTSSTTIENPIQSKTINDFVKNALESVIKIGIPVIALAIIYCGFLFVAAQGNSEKITEAKSALLYTLIGAFILLGAWSISQIISETVLAL